MLEVNKTKQKSKKKIFSPWLKPQQSNSVYWDPQNPRTGHRIQSFQAWCPSELKSAYSGKEHVMLKAEAHRDYGQLLSFRCLHSLEPTAALHFLKQE